MYKCSQCNHETENEANFCNQCGGKMEKVITSHFCSKCGSEVKGSFCTSCGAPSPINRAAKGVAKKKTFNSKEILNNIQRSAKRDLNEKNVLNAVIGAGITFAAILVLSIMPSFIFPSDSLGKIGSGQNSALGILEKIGLLLGSFFHRYIRFENKDVMKATMDFIPLVFPLITFAIIWAIHKFRRPEGQEINGIYALVFTLCLCVLTQIIHIATKIYVDTVTIKVVGFFRSFVFILFALFLVRLFSMEKNKIRSPLLKEVVDALGYFYSRLFSFAGIITVVYIALVFKGMLGTKTTTSIGKIALLYLVNLCVYIANIFVGGSSTLFTTSSSNPVPSFDAGMKVSGSEIFSYLDPIVSSGFRMLTMLIFIIVILMMVVLSIKTMSKLSRNHFEKKAILTIISVLVISGILSRLAALSSGYNLLNAPQFYSGSEYITTSTVSLYSMLFLWLGLAAIFVGMRYRNTLPLLRVYKNPPDFVLYLALGAVVVIGFFLYGKATVGTPPSLVGLLREIVKSFSYYN